MKCIVSALVLLLLFSPSAPAQLPSKESKIRYRDRSGREEVVTGVIRKETAAEVVVKPASGAERAVPSGSILDIEYATPSFTAGKDLRSARNQEQAGKLDVALKQYQDLATKLPDGPLRRHLEFSAGRLTAK